MATNFTNFSKPTYRELTSYKFHFREHSNVTFIMSGKTDRLGVKSAKKGTGGSVVHCCTSTSISSTEELDGNTGHDEERHDYFLKENGWKVRRLDENENEIRRAAYIQSEAFYEPMRFFNDYFYEFFQAEVLSGLLFKLRTAPPNRYACLVAEADIQATDSHSTELVGVVDVTVMRDNDVLRYLPGGKEYLYISGIAVSNDFRRRKVATALLKACDKLSNAWGFEYLVLRAYEDDMGALKLYGNAGYKIVSGDPPWMSTWIGRRRRVVMSKLPGSFEN